MANLSELWTRCNDPTLSPAAKQQACDELADFFRNLLESMYLAQYIRPRIPPIPPPDPYLYACPHCQDHEWVKLRWIRQAIP